MAEICIFKAKETAEAVRTELSELRKLLSQRAGLMTVCAVLIDFYSLIRSRRINELKEHLRQASRWHYPLEDPYGVDPKQRGLFFDDVLALSSLSPEMKECLETPLFSDDEQRKKLQKAIELLNVPASEDFDRWMTEKHRAVWENHKRFVTDLNGPHPTVEKEIKKARREYLDLLAEKGYGRKALELLGYLEVLENLCRQRKIFTVF